MEVTCLRPAVNFNNSIVLSSCHFIPTVGVGNYYISPVSYIVLCFSCFNTIELMKCSTVFFPVPGCYLDVGVVNPPPVVFGVACLDKPSRIRGFFLGLSLLYTLSLLLLQT